VRHNNRQDHRDAEIRWKAGFLAAKNLLKDRSIHTLHLFYDKLRHGYELIIGVDLRVLNRHDDGGGVIIVHAQVVFHFFLELVDFAD